MSVFGAWAAKLDEAAAKLDGELALTVVREQARDFLAIERVITPKRTGALMASESIDSVSGGGTHAVATVGPHIIYAAFRNDGGTIHAKPGLGRKGMRPHTLHFNGVFPLHVTQAGSHYVERSESAARGALDSVAESVIAGILDF